jgi:hypothetical protein
MTVLISNEPILDDTPDLIDSMDKDALEQFARDNFEREIDKRKKIDTLRAEVRALIDGSTQRVEAATEAAALAALTPRTPLRCRHKTLRDPATGDLWEFEWNPLFEGNPDLEIIASE